MDLNLLGLELCVSVLQTHLLFPNDSLAKFIHGFRLTNIYQNNKIWLAFREKIKRNAPFLGVRKRNRGDGLGCGRQQPVQFRASRKGRLPRCFGSVVDDPRAYYKLHDWCKSAN